MDHEIFLSLKEHHERLLQLEEQVKGILKATGLKEKKEETPQNATK